MITDFKTNQHIKSDNDIRLDRRQSSYNFSGKNQIPAEMATQSVADFDKSRALKIPRMRTVHEAAEEMKKLDANTAVTEYHIRRLVLDGVLPKVKAGKKYLINLDSLLDYLANPYDERFRKEE